MSEYTTPTEQDHPERDEQGRFVNCPGPGRPRRQTEAAYLRVLADIISMDDWRELCSNTLQSALKGDRSAREFIARYLLGTTPPTLTSLALHELAGVDDDTELAAALMLEHEAAIYSEKTPFQAALYERAEALARARRAEAEAQAAAERERRRVEREARKAAQP